MSLLAVRVLRVAIFWRSWIRWRHGTILVLRPGLYAIRGEPVRSGTGVSAL